MAYKSGKWTHNPYDAIAGSVLLLPTFDIEIPRSEPTAIAIPWGLPKGDVVTDSGDAFSSSYVREGETFNADQDFQNLNPGHLRRILLKALGDEEYGSVDYYHNARYVPYPPASPQYFEEWSKEKKENRPPPGAQIRLTDLRLATSIHSPRKKLEDELHSVITSVPRPITGECLKLWKYWTLRKHKVQLKKVREWTEKERIEEEYRVMVVSFAAAALALLKDLDSPNLEEAGPEGLIESVLEMAEMVSRAAESLDKSANTLLKNVSSSAGGRPLDPEAKYYTALILYRMGNTLEMVSEGVRKLAGEGTDRGKNWKSKIKEMICKGVEVEQERFPEGANLLARGDEEVVQLMARAAYHRHLEQLEASLVDVWYAGEPLGYELAGGLRSDENFIVHSSSIQLGACLEKGRKPFPPPVE